jgi:hypothetical protein
MITPAYDDNSIRRKISAEILDQEKNQTIMQIKK